MMKLNLLLTIFVILLVLSIVNAHGHRRSYNSNDDRESYQKRSYNSNDDRKSYQEKSYNDYERESYQKRTYDSNDDRKSNQKRYYNSNDDGESYQKRSYNSNDDRKSYQEKSYNDYERESYKKRSYDSNDDRKSHKKRSYDSNDDRNSYKISDNCNCAVLSIQQCGSGFTNVQTACRNNFIARCRNDCSSKVRRSYNSNDENDNSETKSCDCRVKSVRKCGSGTTTLQTKCRREYVERCRRRCSENGDVVIQKIEERKREINNLIEKQRKQEIELEQKMQMKKQKEAQLEKELKIKREKEAEIERKIREEANKKIALKDDLEMNREKKIQLYEKIQDEKKQEKRLKVIEEERIELDKNKDEDQNQDIAINQEVSIDFENTDNIELPKKLPKISYVREEEQKEEKDLIFLNMEKKLPFYRYFNGRDHFYTCFSSEIGTIDVGKSGKYNYKCEGIQGHLYKHHKPPTVPLHRYFNTKTGDHFYTIYLSEIGVEKVGHVGKDAYRYEGIAGYLFDHACHGTAPLYRYYNGQTGDHLYTTNPEEIGTTVVGEIGKNNYVCEAIYHILA